MAKLFAIAALATAAAWLATAWTPGHYGFLIGAIVFVAVFVPGSVWVRYWSGDDFRLMASIAARLGPPGRVLMRGLNSLQRPPMNSVP
jgi:hypothetical protein